MPSAPVSDLPNLGPVTRRWLSEVGIADVATLRATGAVPAFVRLRFAFGRAVSLNALYAIDAALRGVPWTALSPGERDALRHAAQAALPEPEPPPRSRRAGRGSRGRDTIEG